MVDERWYHLYAHAPASALSQVVALRVHLDASTADNGPLRVFPKLTALGVLTDQQVRSAAQRIEPVTCTVDEAAFSSCDRFSYMPRPKWLRSLQGAYSTSSTRHRGSLSMGSICVPHNKLVLLPGMDGTGDLFGPLIDQLRGVVNTVVVRYPTAQPRTYSELTALAREALPQRSTVSCSSASRSPVPLRYSLRPRDRTG